METIHSAKYGGYYADDIRSAVKILYENKYHTCIISAESTRQLDIIITGILNEIRLKNQKIDNIDEQMLPTVYHWKPDSDSHNLWAAEVSMGKFGEVAGNIYMFSQPNYSVLSDPNARKPMSTKAMSSLAMLGWLLTKNKKE